MTYGHEQKKCGRTQMPWTEVVEWLGMEGLEVWTRQTGRPLREQIGVHARKSRRAARMGVRASVVAKKRGNARGVKGRRKVEAQRK